MAEESKKMDNPNRRQLHLFNNNKIMVETGSHVGHGIQEGLEAGFEKIISFEIAPTLVESCQKRFHGNKRVTVVNASSRTSLWDYIKDIQEPITFWLDAHWSQEDTTFDKVYCPILEELDAIAKHPIKTHTIMIDDVRLFGTWEFNFISIRQVTEKVMAINPNYRVQFLDGHIKHDILVFDLPPPSTKEKTPQSSYTSASKSEC